MFVASPRNGPILIHLGENGDTGQTFDSPSPTPPPPEDVNYINKDHEGFPTVYYSVL